MFYLGVPSKFAIFVRSMTPSVGVLHTHVGAPSTGSHLVPSGSPTAGLTPAYKHRRRTRTSAPHFDMFTVNTDRASNELAFDS